MRKLNLHISTLKAFLCQFECFDLFSRNTRTDTVTSFKKVHLLTLLITFGSIVTVTAQDNYGNDANVHYENGDYAQAETLYRKALKDSVTNFKLNFNLGNSLYKQDSMIAAAKQFENTLLLAETEAEKAASYHNIGNAYLKQKKYDKSIAAYKNSLRINPSDEDSRYNLAWAKIKKEEEENEEDEEEEEKKDEEENEEEQEQPQQQENKLSKEDAKRLLDAMKRASEDVEKNKEKQATGTTPEKDW